MALEGTLRDFGLPDIFQLIGMQRKTGVLTLTNDRETVAVTFHQGQVVGAEPQQRNIEDLLGSVLVRTGRITEAQLQEALKVQARTLQRTGYILVQQGVISEQELREALHVQVTQIVYRLFRWRDGRYQFAARETVEFDQNAFTPVPAETILMEGARMVDEWPILERRIRSTSIVYRKTRAGATVQAPVRSLADADGDFEAEGKPDDGIRLSQDERQVLRLVDGRAAVQDLVDRCSLQEFDTYRALLELLDRNLIEEVPSAAVAGMVATRAVSRLPGRLATAAVVCLALMSVASLRWNPLSPWRLAAAAQQTDRLRTYASRGRLERIDRALEVFYLDTGSLPRTLDPLAGSGDLRASDLLDPWGRSYAYELRPSGYRLAGGDSQGRPAEGLTIQRRFSASRRMLLESATPAAP